MGLDSWTQHCQTIRQLDTKLSDYWIVGYSTVQPLDSWTQHCPTIGQLDTALSDRLHVFSAGRRPTSDRLRVFSKPKLSDGRQFVRYNLYPLYPVSAPLGEKVVQGERGQISERGERG